MSRHLAQTLACVLLAAGSLAEAQVTYTCMSSADAFLATGSSNNPAGTDLTGWNYGGAGTLVVAPAACAKGEFQSVLKFSLSNAPPFFDAACGTNNWTITGLTLELASNYGVGGVQPNNPIFGVVSGGSFVIEWLAQDDWAEGTGTPSLPATSGVTYHSLPGLLLPGHEALCTNTYAPPGNNVHLTYPLPLPTSLVAKVASGGDVSLLFYAADSQINYLFNSRDYGRGNEPLIHVSAAARLKILSAAFTNGVFRLTALGGTNSAYQVQASSDLATTNWQTLGAVTTDGTGAVQYDDATATNYRRRFYRLSP